MAVKVKQSIAADSMGLVIPAHYRIVQEMYPALGDFCEGPTDLW